MAKIRAYKIAEELGIDRNELVEKARTFGIDLKSPMASLEDSEVLLLREKLGLAKAPAEVVEERVASGSGTAVIRRRKRVAPPPPLPEPAAPLVSESAPASVVEVAAEPVQAAEVAPAVEEPAEPIVSAEPSEEEAARPRTGLPAAPPAVAVGDAEAPGGGAAGERKGKQRKRVREVVNLREQEQIARQVAGRVAVRRPVSVDPRSFVSPRRKRRDAPAPLRPATSAAVKPTRRAIRIDGSVSVAEFAKLLGVKAPELQGRLMALGTMVGMNQTIDLETAAKVASGYGFEVQDVRFREEELLGPQETGQEEAPNLVPRPPIVTVMGHVDHGKTSLLDALRETNVVAGEAGGITQHIGAYQVSTGGRKLTFIDTPGHEAFTMMRARGAQVTDIVVLVVAATEGIMPQTVEAIDHAKAADVPIIVAVNKIDLPDANPQLTRQRLMEHGLVPEEFGGETICVNISALKRTGLEQLLEMIHLQAEVLELRADPARRATGVVLEAELDRGRGPVATVLVQDGTLHRGDVLVVGTGFGRVRLMQNEFGQKLDEAGPATPAQVVGLSAVPEAGQVFHVVENERVGKDIVEHRIAELRGRPAEVRPRLSLEDFFAQSQDGGVKELAIVLKADVQGSLEAVRDALIKLSTDAVKVDVIHTGVGGITESDVMLAKASNAIVIGFHVRPDPAARRAAEGQGVDLRLYQIIYEATDDVRRAMAGLLPPTVKEVVLGRAEVRRTFSVPKVGTIGGSYVLEGLVRRGALCRLVRDGVQIYEGRIGSLKRFKDDAREVLTGFECGIGIDGYNDLKVGDVIEVYAREEQPATL
jgi:translation initiation factor IF-2